MITALTVFIWSQVEQVEDGDSKRYMVFMAIMFFSSLAFSVATDLNIIWMLERIGAK